MFTQHHMVRRRAEIWLSVMDFTAKFQPGRSDDIMEEDDGCRPSLESSRGRRCMAPTSCFTHMSSLCVSNRPAALVAACAPFVKGSFHAFVEMINNAPPQILQKERISCSEAVSARSLCTRAAGLCLRCEDPDPAPLTPLLLQNSLDFSASECVKWQESGSGWELRRCFPWPSFCNVAFP